MLAQLAQVPDERRGARFVCSAALALPGGQARVVEGVLRGRLGRTPRGAGGFGYDPVLVPDGEDRTTAEMTAQEKNAIFHRGRAFRALAPHLQTLLGSGAPD